MKELGEKIELTSEDAMSYLEAQAAQSTPAPGKKSFRKEANQGSEDL